MGKRHRDVLIARTGIRGAAGLLGVAALVLADAARAADNDAVVFPSVTPVAECMTCPTLHRPDAENERQLATLARELDSVVVDEAQDLGLRVDLSARPVQNAEPPAERVLLERAQDGWVFSPRIAQEGSHVVVRIVAVAPGSKVLLVRTEELKPEELEVRAVLVMRDLVHAGGRPPAVQPPTPLADERKVVHAARSRGRAVLALNAAVLGGYVGFSLQRATGSTDARVTYPLIALGAGLGLGGSMIATEEWDVGTGDAWYLSAGMWWPTLGALFIADSYHASDKKYLWSAGAALGGVALATTAIAFGPMNEGGALITHSGGAFGTVLGGVFDLAVRGRTDLTPQRGMGIGAITGVVVSGALARFAPAQPASRVLLVDLSAGLGGLAGAALGSPLIFSKPDPTDNRLWLSAAAVGMVVGAGVGFFTTRGTPKDAHDASNVPPVIPVAGVIDAVTEPNGTSRPVTGAGVRGTW